MLLTRILTAIVGIPLIFICIYLGGLAFFAMMFVVIFFCVHECLTISKKYKPHTAVSLIMVSVFLLFLYFCKDFSLGDKYAISAVEMLFVLFTFEVFGKNPDLCVGRISVSFFSAFFIPLALMHMVYIRQLDGGMLLMFFLFIVVWTLDTAAYAFGKKFGKHKLAPNVSPKKTIEGAVAGIIFGIIAAVACRCIFMEGILTIPQAAILGFAVAVIGQFSDLAESLVKRDGNIKDSGKIIPGHGGVFDRFDSYIFAAPAMYYILQIFK